MITRQSGSLSRPDHNHFPESICPVPGPFLTGIGSGPVSLEIRSKRDKAAVIIVGNACPMNIQKLGNIVRHPLFYGPQFIHLVAVVIRSRNRAVIFLQLVCCSAAVPGQR